MHKLEQSFINSMGKINYYRYAPNAIKNIPSWFNNKDSVPRFKKDCPRLGI
jgi:hypothetical protein